MCDASEQAGRMFGSAEAPSPDLGDAETRSASDVGRRLLLAAEFLLFFFGVPLAMRAGPLRGAIIPCLLLAFSVCLLWLLRDRGFDRSELWGRERFGGELGRFGPRFAALALVIGVAVWFLQPEQLFNFPRRAPVVWLLVMLLYPLLSVYPQEMIFRTFLFRRYRDLFGHPRRLVWASAVAFGFVHILFDSWLAVALTIPGGYLFADTYRRSRSLLAASVEHALYGCLIFTIGLGRHFYNGA